MADQGGQPPENLPSLPTLALDDAPAPDPRQPRSSRQAQAATATGTLPSPLADGVEPFAGVTSRPRRYSNTHTTIADANPADSSAAAVATRNTLETRNRWALIRRLLRDGTLQYSAQDQEMARLQAALRNTSYRNGVDKVGPDGVPVVGLRPSPRGSSTACCFRLAVDDDARWKQTWDIAISCVIMYSVCVLPWRLGFNVESTDWWYLLETSFTDILFGLDMLLSFFTYQRTPEGTRRTRSQDVGRYLKSWFLIDFFSTVPFDLLATWAYSGGTDIVALRSVKLVRVLRLVRLLKMARLLKLARLRAKYRQGIDWAAMSSSQSQWRRARPALMRLCGLLASLLFTSHLLACCWHGMLSLRESNESASWWDSAVASGMVEADHSLVPTAQRYLLSLYFVTATMMAVGYGDLYPVTTGERAFAILVQIVGASFIGVLLATVGQLLDSLNARSHAFSAKLQEVRDYMKDRKLPKELRARILDYYSHYFEKKTTFNEAEIFNGLSLPLRHEILKHANKKLMDSLRLFRTSDPNVCTTFLRLMRPLILMPGEMVATEGSLGREMYFLVSGTVELRATISPAMCRHPPPKTATRNTSMWSEDRSIGMNTAGVHFGTIAVFKSVRRPCSYKALGVSDVHSISKQDLEFALYDFPAVRKRLSKEASQQLKALTEVKSSIADAIVKERHTMTKRLSLSFREPPSPSDSWKKRCLRAVCTCACPRPSRPAAVAPEVDHVEEAKVRRKKDRRYSIARNAQAAGMSALSAASGNVSTVSTASLPAVPSRGPAAMYMTSKRGVPSRATLNTATGPGRAGRPIQLSIPTEGDGDDNSVEFERPKVPPTTRMRRPSSGALVKTLMEDESHTGALQLLNGKAIRSGPGIGRRTTVGPVKLIRTFRLGRAAIDPVTKREPPLCTRAWRYMKQVVHVVTQGTELPNAGDVVCGYHVTEDSETESNLRRRLVLHPDDQWKLFIDTLVLLCVLVSTVEVPLVVGLNLTETYSLTWFELSMDLLFVIDMIVNFRTGFYHTERVLDTVGPLMARRYLSDGFAVDFLSTFPFDRVLSALIPSSSTDALRSIKLIRFIRMFRLLKMIRFLKFRAYMRKVQRMLAFSPHMQQLTKLAVQVLVIGHILGCFFYWTSITDSSGGPRWWTSVIGENHPMLDAYVASVYWAFTTMATVGYGDVVPVTSAETGYVIMSMILGAVVFGYVVGTVGVAATNLAAPALRHSARMQELVDYLHERRVPPDLFARTCTQFNFYLNRKSAFDEDVILGELTDSLRQEVIFYLNADVIRTVPYFLNKDMDFVLHVVSLLRPQFVHTGEFLFRQGEVAWELFFLTKGEVEIVLEGDEDGEEEKTLAIMQEGSYFGELSLLLGLRRSASARAREPSNVFVLSREGIQQTILTFPAVAVKMQETLRRNMDTVQVLNEFTNLTKRKSTFGSGGDGADDVSVASSRPSVRDLSANAPAPEGVAVRAVRRISLKPAGSSSSHQLRPPPSVGSGDSRPAEPSHEPDLAERTVAKLLLSSGLSDSDSDDGGDHMHLRRNSRKHAASVAAQTMGHVFNGAYRHLEAVGCTSDTDGSDAEDPVETAETEVDMLTTLLKLQSTLEHARGALVSPVAPGLPPIGRLSTVHSVPDIATSRSSSSESGGGAASVASSEAAEGVEAAVASGDQVTPLQPVGELSDVDGSGGAAPSAGAGASGGSVGAGVGAGAGAGASSGGGDGSRPSTLEVPPPNVTAAFGQLSSALVHIQKVTNKLNHRVRTRRHKGTIKTKVKALVATMNLQRAVSRPEALNRVMSMAAGRQARRSSTVGGRYGSRTRAFR